MKAQTVSAPLVQAVENAWSAIQAVNPDVPDVVVTLGAGRISRGLKLGHFAANVWTHGDDDVHELFVGAEGLQRGAQALMGTLIHEAVHALCESRGIKDTSRQGRYHNSAFKAAAEELGISVAHDASLGWSVTTVPDETAAAYESEILDLDASISAYRKGFTQSAGTTTGTAGTTATPEPRTTSNNGVSATCSCQTPRKIRVSKSTMELGLITCNVCNSPFVPTA